jgi:hypothetical protein
VFSSHFPWKLDKRCNLCGKHQLMRIDSRGCGKRRRKARRISQTQDVGKVTRKSGKRERKRKLDQAAKEICRGCGASRVGGASGIDKTRIYQIGTRPMVLLLRSSSRQTNKKRLLMTRFINLHNRGGFQENDSLIGQHATEWL